jgi:hypothetical protein
MRRKSTARNAAIAGTVAAAGYALLSELSASKHARIGSLIGLFGVATAVMSTNSVKARTTEARVAAVVAQVGTISETLGSVSFSGTGTLDVTALQYFTNATNTSFLSGCSKMSSPGGVATDPNSGSSWADGERADYIVTLEDGYNSLLGTAISSGFMNPA